MGASPTPAGARGHDLHMGGVTAPLCNRYKVWTVLHNFDGRTADGTTLAARFFGRAFPDLLETVLSYIAVLPRPRHRAHASVLRG